MFDPGNHSAHHGPPPAKPLSQLGDGTSAGQQGGVIPLFSYGALQDIGVQEQFLGRTVDGTPDHLPGFVLTVAELDDTDLIAATGSARHPMAVLGTSSGTRVRGTVYLLTEAELDAVDRHSGVGFHRVPVELGSGITAWAYVDRRYRPPLLSRGAVPAESQELAA